jgi:hypothetical protein
MRGGALMERSRAWTFAYLVLFFYRCGVSVLAQLVIARLTTLGDSSRYQQDVLTQTGSIAVALMSVETARDLGTMVTEAIGVGFFYLAGGNPILINLGFQSIGFMGLLAILREADASDRKWLYAFFWLPSFTVWSSVAGKEALLLGLIGILLARLTRAYRSGASITVGSLALVLVISVFKPYYAPALLFLFLGTMVCARVRQHSFVALIGGLISLIPLLILKDWIDEKAFELLPHFLDSEAGSNREPFFVEPYDVFIYAPYGMALSFIGPTVFEAGSSALHLLSFVESGFVLVALLLRVLTQLYALPAYMLIIGAFTMFWLLFATYPFGVLNPGTAVRYRASYFPIIVFCAVVLWTRRLYLEWQNVERHPHDSATSPANAGTLPGRA